MRLIATYLERNTHKICSTPDDNESTTECVNQQGLAAVKVEMENRVDQLHPQLNSYEKNCITQLLVLLQMYGLKFSSS